MKVAIGVILTALVVLPGASGLSASVDAAALPSSISLQAGPALVPPGEPEVRPEIAKPKERDADDNGIDDRLEIRLREIRAALGSETDRAKISALESQLSEPVRVQLVFSEQVTQDQIDRFLALGGRIDYIYRAVSYGWNATLPRYLVEVLRERMGDSLLAVVADTPARLHLDEATRTGRVRPVWTSGFAGNPSGFLGSSNTTIAIIDSGVDDSHTDLSGRLEYWKDWTSDNEPSPRDIIQHGTHVAGIALGTGDAGGAMTSHLLYTDSGDMSDLNTGYFYPSPIHVPNGLSATLSSTATWVGNISTTLYGLYRPNGNTGSYYSMGSTSGSSPLSLTTNFTATSGRQYSAALSQTSQGPSKKVKSYAVVNTVTYSGVGDGFNTFQGVASGCRWAGAKVFTNSGSGSALDIEQAIDDMVAQRVSHNIKVANMSLGIIGDPGISTTLRSKVNNMVNNGIVAVVSAGNDGPGTSGANLIDDPGRASLAITVAASNDINQLTDYTSSGFTSPGSDEDNKPDVMAPGGSYYYSLVISADTNDADAESTSFADRRANDYLNIAGTSMAAPFVSGATALVIQALEEGGLTWNFNSSAHPLLVKMLLCATCTESNAPREVSTGTNPSLGRASSPKDLYEGYGLINADAAVEAAGFTYEGGTLTDSTAGGYFDRRAWARKVTLTGGTPVTLNLDVPSSADFDLYLYSGTPDSKGNPVIRRYSTTAGSGADEAISFTPSASETGYLVIKRVSGSGTWTLTGSMAPIYTISGNVDLQFYSGDKTQVQVNVQFRKQGGSTTTRTVNVDSGGNYTLSNVSPGTYDLAFKASHWLQRVASNVQVSGNVSGVNVSLENGDLDGDNILTIGDAGLVLWYENAEIGDPNYNPDWDVDGDGVLSIGDAGIILWNENLEGDP